MNRRMIWQVGAAVLLAVLFGVDRFVLNAATDEKLAAPISRPKPISTETLGPAAGATGTMAFLAPLSDFSEVWTRPIFTPSRQSAPNVARPFPPIQTNIATDQPPPFRIKGVALGPDGGAVLIALDSGTTGRYYLNDTIEDWTIEKIETDNITVSRGISRWLLPVNTLQ